MKTSRASLGAVLLVAACSSAAPTSVTPTADSHARDALVAAIERTGGGSYTFSVTTVSTSEHITFTGSVQPTAKAASTHTVAGPQLADTIVTGAGYWSRGNTGPNPDTWIHFDLTRLPATFRDTDPTRLAALPGALRTVRQTGVGTYTGTFDATKANPAGTSGLPGPALSPAARATTFQVTVDASGRLSAVTATMPPDLQSDTTSTVTARYTDFGTAPAVSGPPANRTIEATPQAYTALAAGQSYG